MRNHFTPVLVVLCLVFTLALGEVINGDRSILGKWDASGSTETQPAQTGTTLPGTCVANSEVFIDTDATPAGQQVYLCDGAGTGWNLIGDGGGGAVESTHFIPLICDTPDIVTDPGESAVQILNLDPIQAALWHLYDDGSTEADARVFCHVRVPENLGATPAAAIVLDMASSNTTASKTVRLQVSFANIGNTETHDATLTAEAAVTTGNWPTVAFERFDFTEVLSAQPTAGDYMAVDILRDVDNAGDNMDLDVLIFDAFLRIDLLFD